MRVTNSYKVRTYLKSLNQNMEYLSKLQEQQSSGQKLLRPSDDPFGVSRTLNISDSITRNKQYGENIDEAINWINTSDEALDKVSEYLKRIYSQINAAANGTNSETEMFAYKAEIQECIEGIGDMLNANYNGSYIFAGYKTTEKPIAVEKNSTGVTGKLLNTGDQNLLCKEISPGVTVSINTTAYDILLTANDLDEADPSYDPTTDTAESLSKTFEKLMEAMTDPAKKENLSSDSPEFSFLDKITAARDNIARLRAQIGAKQNRMDAASAKNAVENENMTEVLAKTADIDIAEMSMLVSVALATHEYALMVGSQILQQSLLSFLK
ncbi:flagellar hook-associated protein 3 [Oxobacter pfennigii]|uniref:Flagellar hook-associated protein 3 n=1 Tax=Oxobacter pfennigii TaxID=36849 RepID=A0A0P8WAC6_9CLOT|nr:flagellar hook-associated protein FlgL [Oxobacter pfennigii]KPU44662.1 flagellar hook-associated protein 3 [Oxobacter pfennigii]